MKQAHLGSVDQTSAISPASTNNNNNNTIKSMMLPMKMDTLPYAQPQNAQNSPFNNNRPGATIQTAPDPAINTSSALAQYSLQLQQLRNFQFFNSLPLGQPIPGLLPPSLAGRKREADETLKELYGKVQRGRLDI